VIWILTDRRYMKQRMPLAVRDWLQGRGSATRLVVADEGDFVGRIAPGESLGPRSPWEGFESGDVVLARSRHPLALALLKEAEARGARSLNPWSGIIKSRNKVRATLALTRRGLPVPPTYLAYLPEDLRHVPDEQYPLVLKPFQGDNAAGIVIAADREELQSIGWDDTLVLAQPYIDTGGIDLKIYMAGVRVWATYRASPLADGQDRHMPAAVTPELRKLAEACGEVFGLGFLGLDVLESSDGPVIVDVNDFPNYTGIDDAPEAIGELVLHPEGDVPSPSERRTEPTGGDG
jgi:ribosomal protein S6--L-glutamate ligase